LILTFEKGRQIGHLSDALQNSSKSSDDGPGKSALRKNILSEKKSALETIGMDPNVKVGPFTQKRPRKKEANRALEAEKMDPKNRSRRMVPKDTTKQV